MRATTELAVALDFSKPEVALDFVDKLRGLPVIYKVGLELFMVAGPDFTREMLRRRARVFLDLKFHDIPNTVVRAARQAAMLHVEMFTLHLAGGARMVREVRQELDQIEQLRPKVLGVSVLTSFNDVQWGQVTQAIAGHSVAVGTSVEGLVSHATAWGCDGVVCSALELAAVRAQAPGLFTVVPGIRPEGMDANDQARVMTPGEAHALGAGAVVMGRPITEAPDPRAAAISILRELGHGLDN